jgi:hypothetical protein
MLAVRHTIIPALRADSGEGPSRFSVYPDGKSFLDQDGQFVMMKLHPKGPNAHSS